jgi:hypothetical protein
MLSVQLFFEIMSAREWAGPTFSGLSLIVRKAESTLLDLFDEFVDGDSRKGGHLDGTA